MKNARDGHQRAWPMLSFCFMPVSGLRVSYWCLWQNFLAFLQLPSLCINFRLFTLEKEMITHSTILACKILWAEEPDVLQSMGSQRVKQDGLCLHTHACTHRHIIVWKSYFSRIILLTKVKSYYYRPMCSRWKCLQFWFSFILVSENCMKSRTFHSNPLEPLSPVSKNYLLALF